MKLIDDIIAAALDDTKPIASVLRQCLVLGHTLQNKQLTDWANRELNGFMDEAEGDALPDYRRVKSNAKGFLVGPFGSSIQSQPIPPACLEREHRVFATTVFLRQPIASYGFADPKDTPIMEWPPNLTLYYQAKIIEGYGLNRAWQEIPSSCLIGLLDTVRNRVLKLALELQDELGHSMDDVSSIPAEKVSSYVTNIIYGGQNVISSTAQTIEQVGTLTVTKGDFASLSTALADLGLEPAEVHELKQALTDDAGAPAVGEKTLGWLSKIRDVGLKGGADVAKALITSWIAQYLGLPPA